MDSKSFSSRLAHQMDCDVSTISKMIDGLAVVLRERAAELDTIAIPGFGNFVAMKKQEHITYDSATGKRMLVPPMIKVEFVAGSKLKKQVSHE